MKAKQDKSQARTQYSSEFKKQALGHADKDGVAAVAKDLGMRESRSTSGVRSGGWRG